MSRERRRRRDEFRVLQELEYHYSATAGTLSKRLNLHADRCRTALETLKENNLVEVLDIIYKWEQPYSLTSEGFEALRRLEQWYDQSWRQRRRSTPPPLVTST